MSFVPAGTPVVVGPGSTLLRRVLMIYLGRAHRLAALDRGLDVQRPRAARRGPFIGSEMIEITCKNPRWNNPVLDARNPGGKSSSCWYAYFNGLLEELP